MKSATRLLCASIAAATTLFLGSHQAHRPVHAQDQAPIYSQSVTALYGVKLTFLLDASSSSEISQPELVILVERRPGEFRKVLTDSAPATSIRVTQAITVEELGLPPYSVMRYWWEWNQGDGQLVSTEPVLALYEDTSVPWVWQTSQQGNVVVHAQESNAGEANQALATALEAQRQLALLVGSETQEPLHVYIYPELAQLAGALRLHGLQVQDWVAAYALPDQRVSFVALEDGPSRSLSLQEDVAHEISHLVLGINEADSIGQIPAWFSEGAALSLAAQPDATLSSILTETSVESSGDIRSGSMLCESNFSNLSPHEAAQAYAHSLALFSYIHDRYGASQLQGLLTAYNDGVSCLDAFDLVLGSSYQSLYDQWRTDRTVAIPDNSGTNNLSTWVLGWGVSLFVALLFLAPFPITRTDSAEDAYSTKLRLSQIDDYDG